MVGGWMYVFVFIYCFMLVCKGLWFLYVCEFNDRYVEEYVCKYVNLLWRWDMNIYRGGRVG